ncbi:hypothetical protein E4U32_006209 [Claviceps aff. humidiphila group G2b]|nr:hypothetical protein E4U32_006209 [Claviceps aff. humidiphila group G2b]
MIVVDPHPTQATASSNKGDFRNNVENNDKPVVVQNEPFRSRPTTPASSMLPQRVEARSMEAVRLPIQRKTKRMFMVDAHPTQTAKSSDKGSISDKVENGDEPIVVQHEPFHSRPTTPASSMLHERIAVEKSPSTTHAHGRHSCCCCDIVTEQVVCHVSDEECMCADVMCPENAKTVFATAPAPAPTHTSI